ncbi:hypothetical protein [Microbacterium halophytorum]|uniref:hypothetical protein n=1 Tax=Microbacterium halophytorum TaxID=2067568 RepID=UPI000CFC91C9|nr:hypothetical protein [Microbacterium halophytorum]
MPRSIPTSTRILRAATTWGAIAAGALALIGGVIGYLVAGWDGAMSAIAGAVIAAVLMLMTSVSILIANRWFGDALYVPIFFGIVLGGWILKLIIFIVAMLVLRGQSWIEPVIFFIAVVVGVLASLAIDAFALLKMRLPYVEVALPGDDEPGDDADRDRP